MKDMNRSQFLGQLMQASGALVMMPVVLSSTIVQAEESRGAKAKACAGELPMVDTKDRIVT